MKFSTNLEKRAGMNLLAFTLIIMNLILVYLGYQAYMIGTYKGNLWHLGTQFLKPEDIIAFTILTIQAVVVLIAIVNVCSRNQTGAYLANLSFETVSISAMVSLVLNSLLIILSLSGVGGMKTVLRIDDYIILGVRVLIIVSTPYILSGLKSFESIVLTKAANFSANPWLKTASNASNICSV